jgi:hypothetical protein
MTKALLNFILGLVNHKRKTNENEKNYSGLESLKGKSNLQFIFSGIYTLFKNMIP